MIDLPKPGFVVITIKKDIIEKARESFEKKRSELPRTSFSKFLANLIIAGLESSEKNAALAERKTSVIFEY